MAGFTYFWRLAGENARTAQNFEGCRWKAYIQPLIDWLINLLLHLSPPTSAHLSISLWNWIFDWHMCVQNSSRFQQSAYKTKLFHSVSHDDRLQSSRFSTPYHTTGQNQIMNTVVAVAVVFGIEGSRYCLVARLEGIKQTETLCRQERMMATLSQLPAFSKRPYYVLHAKFKKNLEVRRVWNLRWPYLRAHVISIA